MGGQRGCNRPGHFHWRTVWHRRVTPKSIEQPRSPFGVCSTNFRNETSKSLVEPASQEVLAAFAVGSLSRTETIRRLFDLTQTRVIFMLKLYGVMKVED